MGEICFTYLDTSIGRLLLAGTDSAVCTIGFERGGQPAPPAPGWIERAVPLREAVRQIRAYFAGRLREFDLPLAPAGTPFQQRVWEELQRIPYGETISYGELARRIGRPTAARAVGAANGRNPLPLVIPCHRVIGSTGQLTGFGGGLSVKQRLLELEGARKKSGSLFAAGS